MEKSLLKIAILNDMLFDEINEINPNKIQDKNTQEKIMKLRLRNSLKSCNKLSEIFDKFFEEKELVQMFGNIADAMIDSFEEDFNNFLKENKLPNAHTPS